MDKRKKRTSYAQYNIYLKTLEDDEIFRTGIIPSGTESNYFSKKWAQLAVELNACNGGPTLSAEEWKKRLNDWKNSTRAKQRRILENKTKTSSTTDTEGTCDRPDRPELRLTELEQKAIALWSTNPTFAKIEPSMANGNDNDGEHEQPVLIEDESLQNINECPKQENFTEDVPKVQYTVTNDSNFIQIASIQPLDEVHHPVVHEKRIRLDEFLTSSNQQQQTTATTFQSTDIRNLSHEIRRLADIKEQKLLFEISKFKFRNPGFEYNYAGYDDV